MERAHYEVHYENEKAVYGFIGWGFVYICYRLILFNVSHTLNHDLSCKINSVTGTGLCNTTAC